MVEVLTILVALGLVALAYFVFGGKKSMEKAQEQEISPSELAAKRVANEVLAPFLAEDGPDCRIYIGMPLQAATRWELAESIDDQLIVLQSGRQVPLSELVTVFVCNPGGEMLARGGLALALPEGCYFATEAMGSAEAILNESACHTGDAQLRIEYPATATTGTDDEFYSLSLTNISSAKLRVLRFARYVREEGQWRLDTTTQGYYSARLFREWFKVTQSEWIEPGTQVTCPEVFGGHPGEVLWVFFFETYSSTNPLVTSSVRPAAVVAA